MTNKEAIEVLKGIYPGGAYSPTEEQRIEAINMALVALANMQECHMVETLRTEYEKGRYDMREEMMKDAVDCNIILNRYTKKKILDGFDISGIHVQKFKNGDKVKLIIVKED